jgi:hypothetical protein
MDTQDGSKPTDNRLYESDRWIQIGDAALTRVCREIHWQLELERKSARREALLRMSIGLPPIPRRIDWYSWRNRSLAEFR